MNNDNFQWTDALVREFHNWIESAAAFEDCIKAFKQSKQQSNKPDWEILSFETQNRVYQYAELGITNLNQFLTNKEFKIHSVKRSDNEVFTIGDKISDKEHYVDGDWFEYTINSFDVWGEHWLKVKATSTQSEKWVITNLCSIKKAKQSLFKTEDGKDIYEGDYYFALTDETAPLRWCIGKNEVRKSQNTPYGKWQFSTEEKAIEYKSKHQLKYSEENMRECFHAARRRRPVLSNSVYISDTREEYDFNLFDQYIQSLNK